MKKLSVMVICFLCFTTKMSFGSSWEDTYQVWITPSGDTSCDPLTAKERCKIPLNAKLYVSHQQRRPFVISITIDKRDVGRMTGEAGMLANTQWPARYVGVQHVTLRGCETKANSPCYTFSFSVEIQNK